MRSKPKVRSLGGGQPGPHKVEGIGTSFIPKTFDRSVCDEVMMVMDDDAFGMVKTLAAQEGVLAGSSGGAAVFASLTSCEEAGPREARSDHHSGFS